VLGVDELSQFGDTFAALTGSRPFPWQENLYISSFSQGKFPAACNLPTGLGKTSVVAIWLIALANHPEEKVPRRLVYVVNRRTVVDQTTNELEKLRANLRPAGLFERLSRLCALLLPDGEAPLAISTLRGQFADNREWSADPARPAVVVGTVDMIGSRLLFGGYGVGFKAKPLHAGFLGQDVLLVHDEAHLEPAFQHLLIAIQKEQERCKEFGKFRVMALSATSRGGGEAFELTGEERNPPEEVPDPPRRPVEVVWRRLKAKKAIAFLGAEGDKGKVADQIVDLAKKHSESHPDSAILAYVNLLEDHAAVFKALQDKQAQVLTGTLRGLERDRMTDPRKETGCRIFARFLKPPRPDAGESEQWKIEPRPGTVYLICTSAGEVGIDISADHMICDLTTFERMAQRLGRVNRFGDGDAEIDVVYDASWENKKEDEPIEQARCKTMALLKELPQVGERQSASPLALMRLRQREDLKSNLESAYTPPPTILPVSDILFDSWALTTIRGRLPGRPPVEPYLHGIEDERRAETYIAWREEVWELRDMFEDPRQLEEFATDLLEDYPLKPHELLRDSTSRKNTGVRDALASLARENGEDLPAWIQGPDETVVVTTLGQASELSLASRTVVLPPQAGGLKIAGGRSLGFFDGRENFEKDYRNLYDVADEWWDENGSRRRVRVWGDDPEFEEKTTDMRLVRTIDTNPAAEEKEEGDATGRRFWHWYELPRTGDNDGSKAAKGAVEWQVHTDDVLCNAKSIVEHLRLSEELRNALIVTAKSHDLGKKRKLFQRILGNMRTDILLAKSGKKKQPLGPREDYRHEFGSLLDAQDEAEFGRLSDEMKDLLLHVIAAHHGRGRPHFPADEAFDPQPNGKDVPAIAAEVPRRFARLQRKYGRWGLAYLESLLRAADYAASATPSAFLEEDREHPDQRGPS
jgi:CRISPR-associated endonuclease/helicase Cas3